MGRAGRGNRPTRLALTCPLALLKGELRGIIGSSPGRIVAVAEDWILTDATKFIKELDDGLHQPS